MRCHLALRIVDPSMLRSGPLTRSIVVISISLPDRPEGPNAEHPATTLRPPPDWSRSGAQQGCHPVLIHDVRVRREWMAIQFSKGPSINNSVNSLFDGMFS